MKKALCILCAGIMVIGFNACSGTKSTTTPAISYNGQVKAIIDANCASTCHNATKPAAGIDLTTYAKVKQYTLEGQLIPAIQHAEGVDPMPKKSPKLDDASINTIVTWASGGAIE
ncbi:MAG TPA: hypothetical protein PKL06_13375 [Chitinophagales bacterium]|nr:hypothetical protein [Chitinophagales bacterium]